VSGAKARTSDPITSHLASDSVRNLTKTKLRILALLSDYGPKDRDTLIELWRQKWQDDPTTDQSIRSRLAELRDAGRLEVTGFTTNQRGRKVEIIGVRSALEGHLF